MIHGHPASDCWWHYQDDNDDDGDCGDRDRGDKCANIASYGVDTNWYTDSSATDHITEDANKLSIADKYKGRDRVHIAEGNGMHISHVGHSILRTPHDSLQLKNILHVPSVSKKIFCLFISLLLITMSFLSFTLSSF